MEDNLSPLVKEVERKERKLKNALMQGEQINNLSAAPEWKFFENYLKDSHKAQLKRLASTEFVNDHNGYLYTAASAKTIENILDAIDRFKQAFDFAVKELNRFEDASNE